MRTSASQPASASAKPAVSRSASHHGKRALAIVAASVSAAVIAGFWVVLLPGQLDAAKHSAAVPPLAEWQTPSAASQDAELLRQNLDQVNKQMQYSFSQPIKTDAPATPDFSTQTLTRLKQKLDAEGLPKPATKTKTKRRR